MTDEIQRKEFWESKTTKKIEKNKTMVAHISKLYYTNNDSVLCVEGWINYNGEIFEKTEPLLKIDLSDTKPVWFLCINDSCEQIINDNNFISLVCEGIED